MPLPECSSITESPSAAWGPVLNWQTLDLRCAGCIIVAQLQVTRQSLFQKEVNLFPGMLGSLKYRPFTVSPGSSHILNFLKTFLVAYILC